MLLAHGCDVSNITSCNVHRIIALRLTADIMQLIKKKKRGFTPQISSSLSSSDIWLTECVTPQVFAALFSNEREKNITVLHHVR